MKAEAKGCGHWEESQAEWYEQEMHYCECCGILIPCRQFVLKQDGQARRFCSPGCAVLGKRLQALHRNTVAGNKQA